MQYRRSLETVYTENKFNDTSTFIFQNKACTTHAIGGTKKSESEKISLVIQKICGYVERKETFSSADRKLQSLSDSVRRYEDVTSNSRKNGKRNSKKHHRYLKKWCA